MFFAVLQFTNFYDIKLMNISVLSKDNESLYIPVDLKPIVSVQKVTDTTQDAALSFALAT